MVAEIEKLLCGGRKTENLIESTCFYLKLVETTCFVLILVESTFFAMTIV